MSRKLWQVAEYDKKQAAAVAEQCDINEFAALLLHSRGMKTADDVAAFLKRENTLSAPWLLKDMDKAVCRIREALEREEKITVFGDYDADGVTATALLTSYLEMLGADVVSYIPSRMTEGYGLNEGVCDKIIANGSTLVVTVDNGIGAMHEADYLREHGVDLVVTDHHRVGAVIPDCCAVVDPWREDDTSPFKEMAGVGVALKLAAAMEDGDYESLLEAYADIVAVGTIADIVPLVGENRTVVLRGLELINEGTRCGISALRETGNTAQRDVNSLGVAFSIAPRINAAGRMGTAEQALRLLLSEDEEESFRLAEKIEEANTARQETETAICAEVEKIFEKNPLRRFDRVLVVDGKDWHSGVIGIVASRLVEKYGRPAIVISHESEDFAKGSGRSLAGFSLYDALCYAGDTLLQFGGHTLAAGFSILPSQIDAFRVKINEFAARCGEVYPSIRIDCRLNPAHISPQILDALQELEPFGAGNPSPIFGLFGMTVAAVKGIGNNKHLRLTLDRNGARVNAVYFNMTPEAFPYGVGDAVDAAVKIEKNVYMGEVRIGIQMKDIRPAGTNDTALFHALALYSDVIRGDVLTEDIRRQVCPDRNLITKLYKYIRGNGIWKFSSEVLCLRLEETPERVCAVQIALDVLTECGVLQKNGSEYGINPNAAKINLTENALLKRLGYTDK